MFNIKGGCYAKAIDMDPQTEPDIYYYAIRFVIVLENVVFNLHNHKVDFTDKSITENTRAPYPIEYISNALVPCLGPHPKNIIMLRCDAFGETSSPVAWQTCLPTTQTLSPPFFFLEESVSACFLVGAHSCRLIDCCSSPSFKRSAAVPPVRRLMPCTTL